uniref:Uncharacterized protein n=1 Tax=Romanomermis culicivorax TaxID=13658 RepID=A0A915IHP4_ROMCU
MGVCLIGGAIGCHSIGRRSGGRMGMVTDGSPDIQIRRQIGLLLLVVVADGGGVCQAGKHKNEGHYHRQSESA